MGTIHANSARDAIRKLQTLPLLAGENISHNFVTPIVAGSIDLVVHTSIDKATGARRITEIAYLTGRVENNHIENEPIFNFANGEFTSALGNPTRVFEKRSAHP